MSVPAYLYRFEDWVERQHVDDSLSLAILAAEGIHGESRVRLAEVPTLDWTTRTCWVDATTPVGRTIARVLTCLLSREFGDQGFCVERSATRAECSSGEGMGFAWRRSSRSQRGQKG